MSNQLIKRIERLERDSHDNDEHYLLTDHLGGLIVWAILIAAVVWVGILFFSDNNDSNKFYYEDNSQFCQHFNMSLDIEAFSGYRCIEFVNDTARYHNIRAVNNRWVFVENEKEEN